MSLEGVMRQKSRQLELASEYLAGNWERIRAKLLRGTYEPQPVRQQLIPKSGGGMRELGIPTVLDRFIQQALLQVLQPRFDPTFSEHSHGFRPACPVVWEGDRRGHHAPPPLSRFSRFERKLLGFPAAF